MSKIKSVIVNAIIIMLIAIMLLTAHQAWHIRCNNILEVKTYEKTRLVVTPTPQTLTKETAKELVSDLYNTPHFYIEKDLESGKDGMAIVYIRLAIIDEGLSLHNYIITYTHELTHIKHQVNNETFTAYNTFKTLYESGNAELKYHAMIYANDVLRGSYGRGEYDCGYYIIEYLKERGEYEIRN